MKKIIFTILGYFLLVGQTNADVKDYIIPYETVITQQEYSGRGFLFSVFEYLRNSIFGVLALIAIAVFIYIGFKILLARGNPEEFKKAIMHFVYAIIGLVVIALSWGLVRMVSSLAL